MDETKLVALYKPFVSGATDYTNMNGVPVSVGQLIDGKHHVQCPAKCLEYDISPDGTHLGGEEQLHVYVREVITAELWEEGKPTEDLITNSGQKATWVAKQGQVNLFSIGGELYQLSLGMTTAHKIGAVYPEAGVKIYTKLY